MVYPLSRCRHCARFILCDPLEPPNHGRIEITNGGGLGGSIGVFTEGPQLPYTLSYVAWSACMLPHFAHIFPCHSIGDNCGTSVTTPFVLTPSGRIKFQHRTVLFEWSGIYEIWERCTRWLCLRVECGLRQTNDNLCCVFCTGIQSLEMSYRRTWEHCRTLSKYGVVYLLQRV